MNKLRDAAHEYLQMRRSLGYKLCEVGSALRNFVDFAERANASYITTDLALRWAQQPQHVQPRTWARRLGMVRQFACWLKASDPRTEIPPTGLLPRGYQRKRPYIYRDAEISKLVWAASQLPSLAGLRGRTYSTIFGLLAVSGMRISEALTLDREDVNLEEGIVRVRETKFGKSRLVAIHNSTRQILANYAQERDRVVRRPRVAAFFLTEKGCRVTYKSALYNFVNVSRQVGLRGAKIGKRDGRGPRLHDLRHRFAVCTLLRWYRAGVDVEREIPKLATYLGHVHVNETYWYLEAVPELLELAARKLENRREVKP